jgi:hypothetical protein
MENKTFFTSPHLLSITLLLLCTQAGCKYDKQMIVANTTCDTTIVTFSGTVQPILTTFCISCHSGPNANNGISVENYTAVKMLIPNGKLLGTITHSPGFSPMPKGANKLSECNIAKIRQWIVRGALNN